MLRGHYAYYGISGNSRRIRWFACQVVVLCWPFTIAVIDCVVSARLKSPSGRTAVPVGHELSEGSILSLRTRRIEPHQTKV